MSIAKAWYVTCDLCDNPSEIVVEGAAAARRQAKAEGYKRKRLLGKMFDLCEVCLGNLSSEARASNREEGL